MSSASQAVPSVKVLKIKHRCLFNSVGFVAVVALLQSFKKWGQMACSIFDCVSSCAVLVVVFLGEGVISLVYPQK